MSDEVQVELRGPISRWIADVLDAVSLARRVSRTEVVNTVLEEWAKERLHEASLLTRVSRGNGSQPEKSGRSPE